MTSSTLVTDYLGKGPVADRPTIPPVADNALAIWLDTDSNVFTAWTGFEWISVLSFSLFAALDLRDLPKSNPGDGRPWLNGTSTDGYTLCVGP